MQSTSFSPAPAATWESPVRCRGSTGQRGLKRGVGEMLEMKSCCKCGGQKLATTDFFYLSKGKLDSTCRTCIKARRLSKYHELSTEDQKACNQASWETRKQKHPDLGQRIYQSILADPAKAAAKKEARKTWARKEYAQYPNRSKKRQKLYMNRLKENPERLAKRIEYLRHNYAENRLQRIAYSAALRCFRLSIPGAWTGEDIRKLFAKQKGCCFYCLKKIFFKGSPWHIDHFIPISRGGTNYPDNLVVACASCNLSKHDKMPWEWMPERFSHLAPLTGS